MTTIDKYMPSQGGLGGVWNKGTTAVGSVLETLGEAPGDVLGTWQILIYAGIAIGGAVLLMIAFSFVNGKQDMSAIAGAVTAAALKKPPV
jgi:hypothetical protein